MGFFLFITGNVVWIKNGAHVFYWRLGGPILSKSTIYYYYYYYYYSIFCFFGDDHPIEGSCRTFSFRKIVECVTRGVMMFAQEIQSKCERVCLTVILGKSSGIIDPENFRKKSKNDTFFFFYFLIGWGI